MSLLIETIRKACEDACIKTYELDIREVVIDTNVKLNSREYNISICVVKTENDNYMIGESDIEIPHDKKIVIPKYIKEFLMIQDIHDWSVLKSMHYHIVSTRAVDIKMLKYLLKYLLTIHYHLYNI